MVVGPNSQVTVDAFVFKSPTTASAVSIEALRGSFRFITGASAKSAYEIRTPTATIGVHGTSFDGHVGDDGTVTIAMWTGAVLLSEGDKREVVSGKCGVLVLKPGAGFERINGIDERTAVLDRLFPFAFRQGWLQAPFRVDSDECENRDFSAPTSDDSNPPPEVPIDID